jgi:hypothetical protein
VSIQEMRVSRQQLDMSFYPHLSLRQNYDGNGFSISIKNSGTGMAIVRAMTLRHGDTYFANWPEVMDYLLPDSLAFGYERLRSNTINGEVIAPGQEVDLLGLDWGPGIRELEVDLRDLQLHICYTSLLDESWILTNTGREKRNCTTSSPDRQFR